VSPATVVGVRYDRRVAVAVGMPWIIGWGARSRARLPDEDASAATSSEIGEVPRSEPGDAARAALHVAGHISDDEFILIGVPPSSRQAVRHLHADVKVLVTNLSTKADQAQCRASPRRSLPNRRVVFLTPNRRIVVFIAPKHAG
jgi:hypothetical protein